jgi:hypothetical protein
VSNSFGRNLQAIFGVGELYEGMGGKPLRSVTLDDTKERVTFAFGDGSEVAFGVEGDCCSSSWIEHLDVPPDVIGEVLVGVADSEGVPWDGHVCSEAVDYSRACGHDHLQVYNTRFRTAKGDVVLEYRNDSNGYYGGYLVRIHP